MKKLPRLVRSRGTVLVTVLLMVAVAAILATDIAYRQRLDIKRTSAFLAREQAFQVLLASEELGHAFLMDDLQDDARAVSANTDPFDNLGDKWYQVVPPAPVLGGAGFVSGELEDLQGRFNINSLFATDPAVAALQKQRLTQLLTNLQVPDPNAPSVTGVNASGLVERIMDWVDDNDQPTGSEGREDNAYLNRDSKPYRTANHIITDVSELLLIEEFTQSDIDKIRDFICFLPRDATLNLNTAGAEVLRAYGFTSPDAFIKDRPDRGREDGTDYSDISQIMSILDREGTVSQQQAPQQPQSPLPPGGVTPAPPSAPPGSQLQGFGVTSNYFLLKANALINGKTVKMNSIIWRIDAKDFASPQPGQPKVTPIKTVLRKLVDPLE
ncbi:MAG: type II secretion system minor pseudopilin GspK [Gammaproteobacteria bacterium]|nr:type II secretion system minor pseudopilin GspK [Gammaproteobacteria bacterium]